LEAPVHSGGIKPINRLVSTASKPTPNPPYKKPKIPAAKFDLFENKPRPTHTYPNKRQKIEGTPPVSHNGSSASPINLDDEPAEKRKETGTQTTKSAQSQTKSSRSFAVEEYQSVENMMRPPSQSQRNRKSKSSDSQTSSGRAGKQFLPQLPAVKLDLEGDPISEDDSAVAEFYHVKKPAFQSARKSNVEVQIPASRQAASATEGTSNSQLSLPKNKMWRNGDSDQPADITEFSKYFPNIETRTQNRRERNNSNKSYSGDDTVPARASARLSSQQAGKPSENRASNSDLNVPLDADVSMDELTYDRLNHQMADTLLAKHKAAKATFEKSKGTASRSQSITVDDFSDDDLANNKADIIKTDFTSSGKAKSKKLLGETRFEVLQVFSAAHKWLVAGSQKKYSLHENCGEGLLTIFDENGSAVPDLVLAPRSISKIVQGEDNSKLVLHKCLDQTAKRSPQICLEFSHGDDCAKFVTRMKKFTPNLGIVPKDGLVFLFLIFHLLLTCVLQSAA
jgi:hypothetical protein